MTPPARPALAFPVVDSLRPVAAAEPAGLPAKGEVRRILCLKLDHIGDMLIGAPALLLLRRSFPEAHVTLICAPWNVGLARRLGVADAIHTSSFFSGFLLFSVFSFTFFSAFFSPFLKGARILARKPGLLGLSGFSSFLGASSA